MKEGTTQEGTGLLSKEQKRLLYVQKTSFIHELGTKRN